MLELNAVGSPADLTSAHQEEVIVSSGADDVGKFSAGIVSTRTKQYGERRNEKELVSPNPSLGVEEKACLAINQ